MSKCYGKNCTCYRTPKGTHAPMDDAERLAARSGYLVSAGEIRVIRMINRAKANGKGDGDE